MQWLKTPKIETTLNPAEPQKNMSEQPSCKESLIIKKHEHKNWKIQISILKLSSKS